MAESPAQPEMTPTTPTPPPSRAWRWALPLLALGLVALWAGRWIAQRGEAPKEPPAAQVGRAPWDDPAAPPWTPSAQAPTYTLKLDAHEGPLLLDAQGQPLARLGLRWVADYGEDEGEGGCAERGTCLHQEQAALAWTAKARPDGAVELRGVYEGRFARVEAAWTAWAGDPRLGLDVKVTGKAQAWIDREALVFEVAEPAASLGRDLRFGKVEPGARRYADRWTPKRVIAGQGGRALHFGAWEGFEGLEAEGLDRGARVTLELDDARNHPFRPLRDCKALGDEATVPRDRRGRAPKATHEAHAQLWVGHTWAPVVQRWPDGRQAALALLDPDPNTTPRRFEALLQGHSDTEDPRFGTGLATDGIPITRALYSGASGVGLEDLRGLASRARNRGITFANASDSGHTDALSTEERGMVSMKELEARVWLDDGQGCESFVGEGWSKGDNGLAGLLASHGYSYVSQPLHGQTDAGGLNLFQPRAPATRPLFLWSNPRTRQPIYHFAAVNLQEGRFTIASRLGTPSLERLVREQGLLVAHMRLDATKTGLLENGLLLAENGHYRLSGELSAMLENIKGLRGEADAEEAEGGLWVSAVDPLLDRVRGVEQVKVVARADGGFEVRNDADVGLEGLTLALPGGRYAVKAASGVAVKTAVRGEGAQQETLVWLDLKPHGREQVSVWLDEQTPLQPLVPVRWVLEAGAAPPAVPSP